MSHFERLLDKCLDLHEQWSDHDQPGGYKLGHHNDTDFIMLYGVLTTPENIATLRQELDAAGVSYRLVFGDPDDEYTNVGITDIGL